jgi:hypothetical protein
MAAHRSLRAVRDRPAQGHFLAGTLDVVQFLLVLAELGHSAFQIRPLF